MDITGILMKKLSEREGTSQSTGIAWKIAEFLVEIPGQYPRHIAFSVRDGQVGRIARFESLIGKTVTVSFDLDAHEYQGRWFNEVGAWGIMEYVAGRQLPQTRVAAPSFDEAQGTPGNVLGGPQTPPYNPNRQQTDDLPFPPAQ